MENNQEAQVVRIQDLVKPDDVTMFWTMTNLVNNWVAGCSDQLEREWVFVVTDRGQRIPHVVDKDNTLTEMVIEELSADIGFYIKGMEGPASQKKWSFQKQSLCAQFIVERSAKVVNLADVRRIAWKDEDCYAFARLPFNRADIVGEPMQGIEDCCPIFAEFLSRFDSPIQAKAYCAWIGSIMDDPANKTHKGVILYGEGRNGKSTQLRMLSSIMKKAMAWKECGTTGDFRTDGFERARVIVFADVNNSNLFTDHLIKSVIGGDRIEINRKNERQFGCDVSAKVIACTNVMPNIRDNIAERRRWIFCSIAGFEGTERPDYQDLLNAEAELIMALCCEIYREHRIGNDIIVDPEALAEVTSTADADVDYFCERNFIRDENGHVLPREIAAIIAARGGRLPKARVIEYLKRNYGARSKAIRPQENKDLVLKAWCGIKLRPDSRTAINFQDSAICD